MFVFGHKLIYNVNCMKYSLSPKIFAHVPNYVVNLFGFTSPLECYNTGYMYG